MLRGLCCLASFGKRGLFAGTGVFGGRIRLFHKAFDPSREVITWGWDLFEDCQLQLTAE